MAYKFFSQKLLDSNDLDLTQVFPERQEMARESNNVTYSLLDIVLFLRDRTENFKFSDAQYVDLDNAISEIINRYYKSKNETNPFIKKEDIDEAALDEFKGEAPKEAFVIKDGEVKSKGEVKAAPIKESKAKAKTKVEAKLAESVVKTIEEDAVQSFKKTLDKYQMLIDNKSFDEDDIDALLVSIKKKLKAFYAFDDDQESIEMAKLAEQFINKNSK
jgi:hypothetical protein